MYFNLLAAALPANVCFTYYHLALPSNQAVSYSMLQLRIMWLTIFSVYFILELSIVLVLGLLYICGTGFEICSCKSMHVARAPCFERGTDSLLHGINVNKTSGMS